MPNEFQVKRFIARYVRDNDGDIGITLFRIFTIIKYKDTVLFYWFKHFEDASKISRTGVS